MSIYKYKAAGLTDAGTVKPVNQDSYYLKMGSFNREFFLLAIVADGMGGTKEGELASRSLTAAFANWFHKNLKTILEMCEEKDLPIENELIKDWEEIILEVTLELNSYSKTRGYEKGSGPGSTLSVIFLYGGTYYVVNCGDSRIYKMSDRLKQITKDHSWAQMARDNGLSEKEIEEDSRSNTITRCIGCGMKDFAEGDYFAGEYLPGDKFLLCTDGLRRVLDKGTLEGIIREDINTKEKCKKAVEMAKDLGEEDNITAIIIETAGEEDQKEGSSTEGTYIEAKGNITEELAFYG